MVLLPNVYCANTAARLTINLDAMGDCFWIIKVSVYELVKGWRDVLFVRSVNREHALFEPIFGAFEDVVMRKDEKLGEGDLAELDRLRERFHFAIDRIEREERNHTVV